MTISLTPAAERALAEAARWCGSSAPEGDSCDALAPLLLALALEGECRASVLLAEAGIDAERVRREWAAQLQSTPSDASTTGSLDETVSKGSAMAPDLRKIARAARPLLEHAPQPVTLATEHLLLGITALEGPLATWLAEHGLSTERVLAEIERIYGFSSSAEVAGEPLIDDERPAVANPADEGTEFAPSVISGDAPNTDASSTVWRILDAEANRAREGLRVVEDWVRFALNDRTLAAGCKELRHALAGAMERLPAEALLSARDTPGDVGTDLSTPREGARCSDVDVVTANVKRVQEALRSLEEFSKRVDRSAAAAFEQLRYRSYGWESSLSATLVGRRELADARLCVLIDGRESKSEFERLVAALVAADVDVLQLRDKRLSDRELLERANVLRQLTSGMRTRFIMNDRPDLAVLAHADGVHVGQDELSVAQVRRIVGPKMLIGVSTHTLDQARQAVLDGANYLGVGPVFPSRTKEFRELPGLELVSAVSREVSLPWFAIGGITQDNVSQVLATGATRIAVSSAICEADDPSESASNLKASLTPPTASRGR